MQPSGQSLVVTPLGQEVRMLCIASSDLQELLHDVGSDIRFTKERGPAPLGDPSSQRDRILSLAGSTR